MDSYKLTRTLSWLAFAGIAVVLLTHFVAVLVVDEHSFVADTISDLAIKEKAWIQDFGLDALALSYFCLGGLILMLRDALAKQSRLSPLLACVSFIAAGVLLIFIAEHNQYANRPGRGESIHIYLVTAFYLSNSLAMLLLCYSSIWTDSLARGLTWIFILGAPWFFFLPDHIDGLYEKAVAVFLLAYLFFSTRFFYTIGQHQATEHENRFGYS